MKIRISRLGLCAIKLLHGIQVEHDYMEHE